MIVYTKAALQLDKKRSLVAEADLDALLANLWDFDVALHYSNFVDFNCKQDHAWINRS